MEINRIYNGYVFNINGKEYKVSGALKIRNKYLYNIIDCDKKVFSIRRENLLSGIKDGTIKYVGSVAPH